MKGEENEPRIKFAKLEAKRILEASNIEKPPTILRLVVNFLKRNNNLEVYKWKFGDNVDGIQLGNEKDCVIGYNQEKHVHRQRFTVAHEIGHFILGHTKNGYSPSSTYDKVEEIEANAFAAELLVPTDMLKKDIEDGLNVQHLSSRYFVSSECLWRRITEEKLLNKIKSV